VKTTFELSGPSCYHSPVSVCSMKQLGVSLLHLDGLPVRRRVTPSIDLMVPIYTPYGWREGHTVLETTRVVSLLHKQLVCETDVW